MNKNFFKPTAEPQSRTQVERALSQRREYILNAIDERKVEPTPELMLELAEINRDLGEADFFAASDGQQ